MVTLQREVIGKQVVMAGHMILVMEVLTMSSTLTMTSISLYQILKCIPILEGNHLKLHISVLQLNLLWVVNKLSRKIQDYWQLVMEMFMLPKQPLMLTTNNVFRLIKKLNLIMDHPLSQPLHHASIGSYQTLDICTRSTSLQLTLDIGHYTDLILERNRNSNWIQRKSKLK